MLSGCIGSRRRDFDVKSYLFTYIILSDENEKLPDGRRSSFGRYDPDARGSVTL